MIGVRRAPADRLCAARGGRGVGMIIAEGAFFWHGRIPQMWADIPAAARISSAWVDAGNDRGRSVPHGNLLRAGRVPAVKCAARAVDGVGKRREKIPRI